MRVDFKCSFYGASKTFTHLLSGILNLILLIFVGPILICGGETIRDKIKSKVLGNYNPLKV